MSAILLAKHLVGAIKFLVNGAIFVSFIQGFHLIWVNMSEVTLSNNANYYLFLCCFLLLLSNFKFFITYSLAVLTTCRSRTFIKHARSVKADTPKIGLHNKEREDNSGRKIHKQTVTKCSVDNNDE